MANAKNVDGSATDLGQNIDEWDGFFSEESPYQEIAMYDFFGLRPYLLRHICRHGKLVEAGCGLGRYVFYFSQFGIDCEGVDFSAKTLTKAEEFGRRNNLPGKFIQSNVLDLPYADNSISTYVSLGVVEHFREGPRKALLEALRILRPGGVAIITTPARSWNRRYKDLRFNLSRAKRRLLGQSLITKEFFQYWYTLAELRRFVQDVGFKVVFPVNTNYVYPILEFVGMGDGRLPGIAKDAAKLEKHLYLPWMASQNVVIAIKHAEKMFCFLSGQQEARPGDLKRFYMPISSRMASHPTAAYYRRPPRRRFPKRDFQWNPPVLKPEQRICSFTGEEYTTSRIFEDYGFAINVSPEALKDPEVNLKLSFEHIQMKWRSRKFLSDYK